MTTIKKLIMALETDDTASIIEDENKDKIDIPSDTITTANDAENVLKDVDELNDSIEEAEEDADTVEKIKDVAIKANDEGDGLPPIAAEMAAISLESIHRRLGIKKQHRLPALESFGSTNTRKQATVIAIEIFEETIKKIWEAIIIAFDKLWEWLINLYNTFFDSAEKIKTTCINMKKLIEQIDESKLVNKPFQSHGARNEFTDISGKFDKSTITGVLDNVTDALERIPNIIKTNDGILSSLIANLQYISSTDPVAHERIHKNLQEAMDSNVLRLGKIDDLKHKTNDYDITTSSPGIILTEPLIKRRVLAITKEMIENNQTIKYNVKMLPFINTSKLGDLDKDIDFVLSKGEMLEMLDKVGTIANKLITNKGLPAKIKEYNNKIDEVLKTITKKIGEIDSSKMKTTETKKTIFAGATSKKVEQKIDPETADSIKYELRATIENYKKELSFVRGLIQNALGILPYEGILASTRVFYFIRDNANQYSSNINVPVIFHK